MKKRLAMILALCVAAAMILTACGQSNNQNATEAAKDETTVEETTAAPAAEEEKEDTTEEAAEEVTEEAADAAEEVVEEADAGKDEAADAAEGAADDAAAEAEAVADDAEEAVKDAAVDAEAAANDAEEAVEDAAADAEAAAKEVKEDADAAVEAVSEEVADAAEEVVEEAEAAKDEAVDAIEEAAEDAQEVVEDAEAAVEGAVEDAEAAVEGAEDAVEEVAEDAEAAAEEVKEDAEAAVEEVKEDAEAAAEGAEDAIEEVAEDAEAAAEEVKEDAEAAVEEVKEDAEAAAEGAEAAVEEVAEDAEAAAEDAKDAAEEGAEDAEAAVEEVKEDAEATAEDAKDAAEEGAEDAEAAVEEVKVDAEAAADDAKDAAEEVAEDAEAAAEDLKEDVKGTEEEVEEAAEEAIEEAAEEVESAAEEAEAEIEAAVDEVIAEVEGESPEEAAENGYDSVVQDILNGTHVVNGAAAAAGIAAIDESDVPEDGESAEGAAAEGESPEEDAAEDESPEGESEEVAAAEGESPEGESEEGAAAEGESPEDAAAEGESAEGESAEGESAEGESAEGESGDSAAAPVELAEPEAAGNGMVTTLSAGGHEVLVYYPADNATDILPIGTSCTAPVFFVFGDGAFDPESAAAYAEETGLDKIAAGEGSSVVFMNPLGEKWTEEDQGAFEAAVDLIDDSSTDAHANGIAEALDFFTQSMSQKIAGTKQRLYLYGEGSGAEFMAANTIKSLKSATTFPDGTTIEFDNTIAGATLIGLETIGEIETNDIPVVAVGCSDEVNKTLEGACGAFLADETADFAAEYDALIGNFRRQAGVLVPVYDWDAEGIVETIATYEVTTSADNAGDFAGTETHPVGCAIYYAKDLDVEEGNVPLVFCYHGGGNTALYEAQATEWPLIGKENGFITVSIDLHYPNVTPTEIVQLLELLQEDYSIDTTRIYGSGFSMGGCKSWDQFEQYPEMFAGLAPMDATNALGEDSYGNPVENMNQDILTPVFYVGGAQSPLPEMPFQDQKCIDRLDYVFDVNDIVTEYDISMDDIDNWENPIWGISGDLTYDVTDQKAFLDSTLEVNLFASADGKYYTAFADATNQSHEVYARNSWAAWDFLSQFSRNPDGSITISDVEYALPSDDGTIVDNSYNK